MKGPAAAFALGFAAAVSLAGPGLASAIEAMDEEKMSTAEVSLPDEIPFVKKGQIVVTTTPEPDLLKASHDAPPLERKSPDRFVFTAKSR